MLFSAVGKSHPVFGKSLSVGALDSGVVTLLFISGIEIGDDTGSYPRIIEFQATADEHHQEYRKTHSRDH